MPEHTTHDVMSPKKWANRIMRSIRSAIPTHFARQGTEVARRAGLHPPSHVLLAVHTRGNPSLVACSRRPNSKLPFRGQDALSTSKTFCTSERCGGFRTNHFPQIFADSEAQTMGLSFARFVGMGCTWPTSSMKGAYR